MVDLRRVPASGASSAPAIRRATNGLGLFSTAPYRTNDVIMRITGRVVAADIVTRTGGAFADNCFRFGPETYLDPGVGDGRYVNHSCEPNAAIRKARNQLFLVASGPIPANREIVIDYSTILGDDDIWVMRCKCGTPVCRKRIRRFGSLPADVRSGYVRRNMVPGYIIATLRTRA